MRRVEARSAWHPRRRVRRSSAAVRLSISDPQASPVARRHPRDRKAQPGTPVFLADKLWSTSAALPPIESLQARDPLGDAGPWRH